MLRTLPRIIYTYSGGTGKDAPKVLKPDPAKEHIWNP